MGKKNIQPTTSSPVSRTLVVAPRPALEELRAEPQEGHISSLTGPDPSVDNTELQDSTKWGLLNLRPGWPERSEERDVRVWCTSYDGDDE